MVSVDAGEETASSGYQSAPLLGLLAYWLA